VTLESTFGNKVSLITGGSSGIGLALGHRIAELGGEVVLVARREKPLTDAADAIRTRSPRAKVETLALDVADEDAVAEKIGALAERLPLHHVFNNAGVVMPGRFLELETKHFRDMMRINYEGAVHVCRAALPSMVKRGAGHVLNVSSMAGLIGIYGYTAYAASKFALAGFSQALRAELWPLGVQVSVCFPPDTDTPQLAFENQYKPAETRAIAGNVKTLRPEEVAEAILRGMDQGAFEIVPGLDGKISAIANRVSPRLVRWVCDQSQKKAGSPARA
jgi:3-dehydrosphinganine reductase